MRRTLLVAIALMAGVLTPGPRAQQAGTAPLSADAAPTLAPTDHPRVPAAWPQLWLVPERARSGWNGAPSQLASAVKLEAEGQYADALLLLGNPEGKQGPLAEYTAYYTGLVQQHLSRPDDARRTFQALRARRLVGFLTEAAALREAECDEALGDHRAALAIYERLAATKTAAPDDVLMRVGRAAKASGDTDTAIKAFARAYYEFPLSDLSSLASAELDVLPSVQSDAPWTRRYSQELDRAERLFSAKRYAPARAAFEKLRSAASGDDREVVILRVGECDYYLKRVRKARDAMRPYIERGSRQAEAMFFYALATRELGGRGEYLSQIRRLVDEFPSQGWAEEALNHLATRYIVEDEEEAADRTLRELYEKFPTGRYAERAAWKIGWRAYKNGGYADTVRIFEQAASDFQRSNYRPSWIYWAGRSHDALEDKALAEARYTLVAMDYLNTYYGRLAVTRLDGRAPERRLVVDVRAGGTGAAPGGESATSLPPPPPNAPVVRALLGVELYDQAINELRYAQRMWGDSAAIQATLGWAYHQQGELRMGITAMKRAYPQYMAAGGEQLPPALLKVLFPVEYWALIRRYSAERHLDPYLMAALIAQESTFEVAVKSSANAYGLMQLLPSTGRRYAKALKMKRFSTGLLTTAETNVSMGTAYFADLMKRFGAPYLALASYNAGEHRVSRWLAERPGVGREEFIDDIPFPETQNYVKRVLGTVEDYRRLYAVEPGQAEEEAADVTRAAAGRAAAKSTKASAMPVSKKSVTASPKSRPAPAKNTEARRPTTRKPTNPASPVTPWGAHEPVHTDTIGSGLACRVSTVPRPQNTARPVSGCRSRSSPCTPRPTIGIRSAHRCCS